MPAAVERRVRRAIRVQPGNGEFVDPYRRSAGRANCTTEVPAITIWVPSRVTPARCVVVVAVVVGQRVRAEAAVDIQQRHGDIGDWVATDGERRDVADDHDPAGGGLDHKSIGVCIRRGAPGVLKRTSCRTGRGRAELNEVSSVPFVFNRAMPNSSTPW